MVNSKYVVGICSEHIIEVNTMYNQLQRNFDATILVYSTVRMLLQMVRAVGQNSF